MPGVPRGVDLNLNQFSLDAPEVMVEGSWLCEPQSKESARAVTNSFWCCVADGNAPAFEEDDLALLKNIFNPNLSDRRAEGECFAPPDTNSGYVEKLRSLVKEEEEVRQKRRKHFLTSAFKDDCAGPLFPASWTSDSRVAQWTDSEASQSHRDRSTLHERSDYAEEAKQVLKSTAPLFHKKTEDGMSFRIYRMGSVEVRTTQEHN